LEWLEFGAYYSAIRPRLCSAECWLSIIIPAYTTTFFSGTLHRTMSVGRNVDTTVPYCKKLSEFRAKRSNPMRNFVAATMAAIMFASSAIAATDTGLLPAGKPAGVKQAQDKDDTVWWVVGLGFVAAGIALVASGSSNGNLASGTVTTTSTSTTTTTRATTTST
jgi:hypothetical protein